MLSRLLRPVRRAYGVALFVRDSSPFDDDEITSIVNEWEGTPDIPYLQPVFGAIMKNPTVRSSARPSKSRRKSNRRETLHCEEGRGSNVRRRYVGEGLVPRKPKPEKEAFGRAL